jgi:EXLDI family protein
MPNKTIYVSDEDMPLFRRVQELTDNLSAAVAEALRRYVELREGRARGFEEITVRVGPPGRVHRKRFLGYPVATWRHKGATDRREQLFTAYRTKGERYAVHWRELPDLTDPAYWASGERWWRDPDWSSPSSGEAWLKVFDDVAAMRAELPPELVSLVEQATEGPAVDYLDI